MQEIKKEISKKRLFIENFLIYGLGGVISRIIPLALLPLITRLMPNTDYLGISDMTNTITAFSTAFALLGMADAVYRLFFEKEDYEYKKTICSTALAFTLIMSIIVFFIMVFARDFLAVHCLKDIHNGNLVILVAFTTVLGAANGIISAPTRMQNKKITYILVNAVSSVLSYALAIPLLLWEHYTIALPVSALIAIGTISVIFFILNRKWFDLKQFDKSILKELLKIAVPLLPNFLVFWIFNTCDKYMITNMIGIGAEGVYGVGSKLGHVSQLIYTAFAGGWLFFAFSTMKDRDHVKTNSRIFEYLGIITFITTLFVCALSYSVFVLLFEDVYLEGFIVAPYLFLAPLLQMLFQTSASQFTIEKKTYYNTIFLTLGAGINIIANYYFIPILGIEGAAIATVLGYLAALIPCVVFLIQKKLFVIPVRFLIASVIFVLTFASWRLWLAHNVIIALVQVLVVFGIYIILYKQEIKSLFDSFAKKRSTRRSKA